ncbi:MAG: dihydrolipoyllysine-residue acetyltransferase [Gammaproteobacteria bacterium]|nr:dihydrolipoyllysine-residue acetyltransferase [Gammaproteobacteria bacterium]
MTEMVEVKVPDIGDFDAVEIIEVLVSPGDTVNVEDSLITLESDKASMEIPSTHAGVIKEVKVKVGDMIAEGAVILVMEAGEAAAAPAVEEKPVEVAAVAAEPAKVTEPAKPAPAPVVPSASLPSPTAQIDEVAFSKAHASPAVRKFARELGVDLGILTGSGRNARILKEDVQGFVKQALRQPASVTTGGGSALGVEPMPEIDFSLFGDIESQPLTKINKLTGKFLHRNWVSIPHVTQFEEADITDLEAFRKQSNVEYADQGVKFTMLSFIMKAMAVALKRYPRFNSSLDVSGENLIMKKYCHIGVAVDTPDGLVVPVVRDVDQKTLVDISRELKEISLKAREKKLKPSDMQGGCISISSLGGIGGTKFTPIVNAPEVAILGVSRADMKPVWNGKEFEPRLMCPLSLSYDHRVIDGAAAARFTSYLSHLLADARRLLL